MRIITKQFLCLVLVATPVYLVAGAPTHSSLERVFFLMGTELQVRIEAPDRTSGLNASEKIFKAVSQVEERLSTWRPSSEFSRINQQPAGKVLSVSRETLRDLSQAFRCAKVTEGRFNPLLGALIEAWDLRGSGRIPDFEERRVALRNSDPANFEISSMGVSRKNALTRLEEGGFGKGIALDEAIQAVQADLDSHLISEVSLNFGGQVMRAGAAGEWVSLADPDHRDLPVLDFHLTSGSIATSGNSEHGRWVKGRWIGHLLDPLTGEPSPFNGSVSVVAAAGYEADCLTKNFFVLGPDKGPVWLDSHLPPHSAQVIYLYRSRGELIARASCGLKGKLSSRVPRLKIHYECLKILSDNKE